MAAGSALNSVAQATKTAFSKCNTCPCNYTTAQAGSTEVAEAIASAVAATVSIGQSARDCALDALHAPFTKWPGNGHAALQKLHSCTASDCPRAMPNFKAALAPYTVCHCSGMHMLLRQKLHICRIREIARAVHYVQSSACTLYCTVCSGMHMLVLRAAGCQVETSSSAKVTQNAEAIAKAVVGAISESCSNRAQLRASAIERSLASATASVQSKTQYSEGGITLSGTVVMARDVAPAVAKALVTAYSECQCGGGSGGQPSTQPQAGELRVSVLVSPGVLHPWHLAFTSCQILRSYKYAQCSG
jgi:hypothetical protein